MSYRWAQASVNYVPTPCGMAPARAIRPQDTPQRRACLEGCRLARASPPTCGCAAATSCGPGPTAVPWPWRERVGERPMKDGQDVHPPLKADV